MQHFQAQAARVVLPDQTGQSEPHPAAQSHVHPSLPGAGADHLGLCDLGRQRVGGQGIEKPGLGGG